MVISSEFLTKQMSFTCKNKYFLRSLNEKKRAINTQFFQDGTSPTFIILAKIKSKL